MAEIMEGCIEVYFSSSKDWQILENVVAIPELMEKEFIDHSLQIGALFTLYTFWYVESRLFIRSF